MKEPLARKHGVSALFRPNVHNEGEIVRNDFGGRILYLSVSGRGHSRQAIDRHRLWCGLDIWGYARPQPVATIWRLISNGEGLQFPANMFDVI